MKKMIFLILSMFIISNLGFSEVHNVGGIIFNDRSFGEIKQCKAIGGFYLMYNIVVAQQTMGIENKESFEMMFNSSLRINEDLKGKGWNKNSSHLKNIDLYYKSKCSKVRKKDFVNTNNKDYNNELILVSFFKYMKDLGMLID